MFEFTLGVGEEAIIQGHEIRVVEVEVVPFRHQYRCCLCGYEGVLEFEPDVSGPHWTECHDCGFDNEISPGLYDRPAIIQGYIPSRIL